MIELEEKTVKVLKVSDDYIIVVDVESGEEYKIGIDQDMIICYSGELVDCNSKLKIREFN